MSETGETVGLIIQVDVRKCPVAAAVVVVVVVVVVVTGVKREEWEECSIEPIICGKKQHSVVK